MKTARVFAVLAVCATLAPATAHAVDVRSIAKSKSQEVWFVADHTLPMIVLVAALPAGSGYDPTGKDGLAAFAAALIGEGAGKYDSTAFQNALAERGIELSASASRDDTIVSLTTLTQNAPQAFRLLGMALAKPRFDAATVGRVRAQILAHIARDGEDPGIVAENGFYRVFFRRHPYAHPVAGDPATVSAITAGDLRAFAKTHWVRAGLKVAVAGDIDAATLKTLLNSAFGALPATAPAPIPLVGEVGAIGVHVIAMDVPQPEVVFGMTGMLRSDPDFLPATIANLILGGGPASRLSAEVRETRGLTSDVGTALVPYARAGVMLGHVASGRQSVREAVQTIRDTMKDFAQNGPTPAELADAQAYLTGSFPLDFDSDAGTASRLNQFERENLRIDFLGKRNDLIDAISAADVQRAAKRLFNPAKMTLVIAGSLGRARPPAAALPIPKPKPAGNAPNP